MSSAQRLQTRQIWEMAAAAGLYALMAVVLFSPHARTLSSSFRLLYAVNPPTAALGVFLLSRRWVSGWMPSAAAGLLYGFGPFAMSFIGFHPLAGFTFAAVGWLLLPAVYWQRGCRPTPTRFVVRAVLCVLPFLFIVAFFWTFSQHWAGRLFLLPRNVVLSVHDFAGFFLPLSMTRQPIVIGLYHSGLIALLMGVFVYALAQRVAVIIPAAVGLVLAFMNPVLGVGSVVWAAFPMLFVAVLAGIGLQSMLWAGKSDSKYLLFCALAALGIGAVSAALYLPNTHLAYRNPALFYLASSAVLGVFFLLSRSGLRWLGLRWCLIAGLILADCYLSARWMVDRLL